MQSMTDWVAGNVTAFMLLGPARMKNRINTQASRPSTMHNRRRRRHMLAQGFSRPARAMGQRCRTSSAPPLHEHAQRRTWWVR